MLILFISSLLVGFPRQRYDQTVPINPNMDAPIQVFQLHTRSHAHERHARALARLPGVLFPRAHARLHRSLGTLATLFWPEHVRVQLVRARSARTLQALARLGQHERARARQ